MVKSRPGSSRIRGQK